MVLCKQLNQLGKGQTIGKSHTFSNGVSLTLDYVMLDENQLLLFYTIYDPIGHVDDHNITPFMSVKAFWGDYVTSSSTVLSFTFASRLLTCINIVSAILLKDFDILPIWSFLTMVAL